MVREKWNSLQKKIITIRSNHVHKWRGKSIKIYGWRKRVIMCSECGSFFR